MRKPEPLRNGDAIDVVAPSSPFDKERFQRGVRALESIGLKPRFTEAVYTRTGHLAGDDARRFAELETALRSDSKAVILARGGRVEGTLAGGNLASLASLCGSPLQPQFRDCIVLLEDLNEPPYRLDRLLTQLLMAGAFVGVKGFVIGDLTSPGEDPAGRTEVVAERLLSLQVPLVFEGPFGHAGRNLPVLFGAHHELDAGSGRLAIC